MDFTALLDAKIREVIDKFSTQDMFCADFSLTVSGPHEISMIDEIVSKSAPGCYIIGRGPCRPYIGMSETNIGKRIQSHLSERVKQSKYWEEGKATSLHAIFAERDPWLAPALEAYLTTEFRGFGSLEI